MNEALWQQLTAASLVMGDQPAPRPPGPAWYVHVLLGFAAWVAAIFITVLIVASFGSQQAVGLAGAIACAAGLLLLRFEQPFITQLGLAGSIAGQAGMFLGLMISFNDFRPGAAALAVVLIVPSLLTTNAIYRAWCTAAAILLLAVALAGWATLTIAVAAAIVTIVFVLRPQIPRAYGYGAALTLVLIDLIPEFGGTRPQAVYAGGILAGIALVFTVHQLLGAKASLYAVIVSLILIPAHGVAAALLLILVGFGRAAPVLAGLGIAAGLGYLGYYYHSLSLTLLFKSMVLMASGLALLALRWALFRKEEAA